MRLSAKLPQDDEGAKLMRFEDVRGQRYTEIFLIGGHAITRQLQALSCVKPTTGSPPREHRTRRIASTAARFRRARR